MPCPSCTKSIVGPPNNGHLTILKFLCKNFNLDIKIVIIGADDTMYCTNNDHSFVRLMTLL